MYSGKYLLNGTIRVGDRMKRGAEGEVYQAFDSNEEVRVLKVKARGGQFDLKPLREVECLRLLHNEHCTQLFQSWVDPLEGNLWLMIEYCNGGDLEDYLASRRLEEEELRDFMAQLLLGVLHIHANCIIHRDIKLSNIFLHDIEEKENPKASSTMEEGETESRLEYHNMLPGSQGPSPSCVTTARETENRRRWLLKIGDFGSSKRVSRAWDCGSRASGTPIYSSPEMAQSRPYTIATDVWSLGVCFYAMMTNRLPFETESCATETALRDVLLHTVPPHPCERRADACSSDLWDLGDIVMAMLTKRPDCRPSVDTLLQHRVFAPSLIQLHWTPMARRWLEMERGVFIPVPSPNKAPLRPEDAIPGSRYQLCSTSPQRPGCVLHMVIDSGKEGIPVHARPHQSFPVIFRLFYGDQVYLHPIALQPLEVNVPASDVARIRRTSSSKPPFLWGKIVHPSRWLGGCVMVRWCAVDRLREVGMLPPQIIQRSMSVSVSPSSSELEGRLSATVDRHDISDGGLHTLTEGCVQSPVLAGTPKLTSTLVVADALAQIAEAAAVTQEHLKASGWKRTMPMSQMG